jgi:hypothetical protein
MSGGVACWGVRVYSCMAHGGGCIEVRVWMVRGSSQLLVAEGFKGGYRGANARRQVSPRVLNLDCVSWFTS